MKWVCRSPSSSASSQSASRGAVVLVPFSTRVPPDVLERLRIAAPQLGLRQGDVTAAALDTFLAREGF
jgi:hypothetical protein